MQDRFTDQGEPLPGDELLPDARSQITRSITIDATPETLWPLLERMAREDGGHGGVILRADAPHLLLLGALYDPLERRYLPFDAPRPSTYWQATWVLVLTPLDAARTRLDVRSRVAFAEDALRWAAVWMHPFNAFMAPDQLARLRRAAERRKRSGERRAAWPFRRYAGPYVHRMMALLRGAPAQGS